MAQEPVEFMKFDAFDQEKKYIGQNTVYISQKPIAGIEIDPRFNPEFFDGFRNRVRLLVTAANGGACQGNVEKKYVLRNLLGDTYGQKVTVREASRAAGKKSFQKPQVTKFALGFADGKYDVVALIADTFGTFQGFCVLYFDDEGIYIDVICSYPGFGGHLLKAVLAAVDMTNTDGNPRPWGNVTLSSLWSVFELYPKFDFQFRSSCDTPPVIVDAETRAAYRDIIKSQLVKSEYEAYDNEVTQRYMAQLQLAGLNVNKDKDCDADHIDKDTMKQKLCANDGFTMKRCTVQTAQIVPEQQVSTAAAEAAAKKASSRAFNRRERLGRQLSIDGTAVFSPGLSMGRSRSGLMRGGKKTSRKTSRRSRRKTSRRSRRKTSRRRV